MVRAAPFLPPPGPQLAELLKSTFTDVPREWAERFGGHFRGLYGEGLLAVLLYGSYLSPSLRKPTSFPDFIVVTKGRRAANLTWGQRVLYPFLPPHALSGSIASVSDARGMARPSRDGQDGPKRGDAELECKYYVMASKDFDEATGYEARDLAIAGRLSKRVGVILASGESALDAVLSACARSMMLNGALALPSFEGPFDLDEFSTAALNVSYLAEFRMTEAGKVKALFNAEADFYRRAYELVIRQLCESGLAAREGAQWRPTPGAAPLRDIVEKMIRTSRRHGKWRLVKHILLFRGWPRYLMEKIERSQGERIELTGLQKRFPLLFAWGHFFRLLREGRLK